ncbi:MAG TPA: AMP-binding protein [candidate division Zixibacteria bacterium]|nr:AMP-binding protein [candidate division Zixibacteria bacterium]
MTPADRPQDRFDDMDTWPRERLRRFQYRKLKQVVDRAYRHLPFYRRRFDAAGVRPDQIRSLEDFTRLPLFTKRDVLREMEERGSFCAGMELRDPADPAALCMTSGTLGSAFLCLSGKWRSARGDSLARYCWWGGLRPGMRALMAAPAWHGLAVQESRALERLGATCVIPWGTFLPRYAGNFLDALRDLRPQFVSMFLPMLYALLAECRRREIEPREAFNGVRHLVLVGAPMTPRGRDRLREELGVADVFEGLGNPEALTAMECSFHCGHHLFLDCCYVEVVDPENGAPVPPGARGTVVVTSLIPHGSLYIRYDSGDVGEILPEPCPCGRTWPRLEVYDRWANAVHVAGARIFPYDVRLCLDDVPELIGVPFALLRGDRSSRSLRLVIQKTPNGDSERLGRRLRARIEESLGIEASAEWTERLPERWKGIAVIEEKDWRGSDV